MKTYFIDRMLRGLGLLGCGALLLACSSSQDALGDPTGSTCPASSTLTYENFGKAFFATNCLSCHASQQAPHFNEQADIQANADEIDRAAASGPNTTNTFMPKDGDVSDAERKKLGEWLACGAS